MTEPEYVSADPFESSGPGWIVYAVGYSGFPGYSLLVKAMDVCGRTSHRFRKQSESTRWKRILTKNEKNIISTAWIEYCIAFAEKKNRGRIIFSFDKLSKYITNDAAMTDWQAKHPESLTLPKGVDYYESDPD